MTSTRPDPARSGGIDAANKDSNGKVISYMWYIHVCVKVSTEDRLRENIAPLLQDDVFGPWDSSRKRTAQDDGSDAVDKTSKIDDLTDYLVLQLFSSEVLGQLVYSAPLLEQADAYARVLGAVPGYFREEFCRRLYVLLFDRGVVEWPRGIDVPDLAAAAATAGTAAAAPARPPTPRQRCPGLWGAVGGEEEEEVVEEEEAREGGGRVGGDEGCGAGCCCYCSGLRCDSPAATWTSPCPESPEHDSAENVSDMARSACSCTATNPSLTRWRLSRNGYNVADNAPSHQRPPAPPHTTPRPTPRSPSSEVSGR